MSSTDKKKVTSLQDLADLAGVSRATVSRALNDSPLISAKTKEKLRALAAQHHYTINRRARDFRLRRTGVVSVVFMLDVKSKQHMSDPFFLDMLGAIADSLAEHDYDLLLAHAPVTDILDLLESRVLQQSDGAIFIGQGEQHAKLNKLAESGQRMVVWGQPVDGKHYTVVGGDNVRGGYRSTKHLLALGRRHIAFFGNTNNPENAARHEGYRKALEEYGLRPDENLQFDVPFEMHRAQQVVTAIINSKVDLDAVVCATDVMALASISTFQGQGIRVPQDVAIVGYDDIVMAAYSSPPLTTVSQNIHEGGRMLVESLLRLINGETVPDTIMDSKLVIRKSSGAAAAAGDG